MKMQPVQFSVSSDDLHEVVGIVSRIALLVRGLGGWTQIATVAYVDGSRNYVIEAYIQKEIDGRLRVRHFGEHMAPTTDWRRTMASIQHESLPFLIELEPKRGEKLYVRWQRG
jgi:hypothetical protein